MLLQIDKMKLFKKNAVAKFQTFSSYYYFENYKIIVLLVDIFIGTRCLLLLLGVVQVVQVGGQGYCY